MRTKWRKQKRNNDTFETEHTNLVIGNVIPKEVPAAAYGARILKGNGFLCVRMLKDPSEKHWTSHSF